MNKVTPRTTLEDLKNHPRPNIFERIYLWWDMEGRYYHKYLKQGIKNTIYWFPIIWKDRHWDQHYIFEILKHKLKAQSKYIGDGDIHTRAKLDSKRMKLCVKLIEKVQDDYYSSEYQDYHKDRIWFTPCEDRPNSSLMNSELVWEKFDDYFKKYPRIHNKVLKGAGPLALDGRDREEIKRIVAINISHLNQQRAQDLLFKIMNDNIQHWWS